MTKNWIPSLLVCTCLIWHLWHIDTDSKKKKKKKKKKWKKISKKKKVKATLAKIPNKFQLKHPYSKRVGTTAGTMKQFCRARITLRDMEKDYTVSTINQANKETQYYQLSTIKTTN